MCEEARCFGRALYDAEQVNSDDAMSAHYFMFICGR